ncbi:plasminogen-binding protein [Helicobacter jaachi]|uniref:Plasminogen-binding protein n=1 Tax=Helicobacter jaachi TaxID=1677920 RepID=A0A4U8TCV6_9HELI|nr:hypothetical protein [Helicobacter jaachi]TLD97514.1 plasminogen-binding protein [Helicobacter jaachi]
MREQKYVFLWIICALLLISGCSSKKHFEPKLISGEMPFKGTLSAPLQSVTRQGATLKDNTLISFWQGITPLVLQKGYTFLTQDNHTYVVQKACGEILIIESSTIESSAQNARNAPQSHQSILHTLPFDSCVISASLKGDKLALVMIDNTLIFYDISAQKEIFSQKYPQAIAINAYLAAPQITNEYVIYPDLEGKILIYSIAQNKIIKDILISSDKFFNNVIYMYAQGNYLLAATAKRVSAIIDDKNFKYDVDLRDVLFANNKVYVLSIEGEILELDHTLKLLRKTRLPFAVLSGLIIHNDTLYTLEKGGYTIAINLSDFTPLVYKNKLPKKKSLFYTKDTFFYDRAYTRFE